MRKRKIKILIIVGTRPNFIKVAPLIKEMRRYRKIESILVHTGQHYDFEMSKVFFQELKIPKPDYNLEVGSGSHAWQTAKIMEKLESLILKEKPDLVIVVGDVNSTLAGALTAAKLWIPVVHIEAGLRSYNKTMPEEINRLLTDHVSDFLFCPTKTAVDNLEGEGIKKGVFNVGDIMYDALLGVKGKIKKSKILKKFKLKPKSYILMTVHRASNTNNLKNLEKIITAAGNSKEKIIFPIHPRTKKQIKKIKLPDFKNLEIIKPVSYLDMLVLEKNAKKILTDSGGVQKEAYWLKVPCLTFREETEWPETVRSGWNVLVGCDEEEILKTIQKFNLSQRKHYNYFGTGRTAKKIMEILEHEYLAHHHR